MRVNWYDFSKMITWSALGSIGNSKLARLTILMPAVGYMILFNSTLQSYMHTKLPDLEENIASPGFWTSLYQQNMYFLYFGLLIFGIGVAMYTIFSPQQVKQYQSAENYIRGMDDVRTNNLVIGSFDHTMSKFLTSLGDEERSRYFEHKCAAFPVELSNDVHRLIEEMFRDLQIEDPGQFYTGSGYLITDEIIRAMYAGSRATQAVKDLMDEQVERRPKDVFYLQYRALNHERPLWRLFVFSFYSAGIMLTVIPSLATSAIILRHWIT